MAENYITKNSLGTSFIHLHYVNIINDNSDKAYAYIQTQVENVEVNDWGEKDPKWKLIFLLTYMVQDTDILKGIKEFKGIDDFKENPRVYLTDRIYNISLEPANEKEVAENLGISYSEEDYSIDYTDFYKVYYYCSTENMCELVYLCMDYWNMTDFIDYDKIIITLIKNYTGTSGSNTTGGDSNANTGGGGGNQGGSNTTGGGNNKTNDDGSSNGTSGSNTSQGTGGKEMSNVILRF